MKNRIQPHSGPNPFRQFLWIKWRLLLRRLFAGWSRKKALIERGSTGLIILVLSVGGYFLFHFLFGYFLSLEQFGRILLDRIFQLGWNTIFFLLILSNIITAFSTLYRSDEVRYYLSAPLAHRTVFHLKMIDNILYSSWALALLGTPIITAYLNQLHIHWSWWPITILFGLSSIIIIAGVVGMFVLLLLLKIAEYTSIKLAFGGIIAAVVVGFIGYFLLSNPPSLVVQGPASLGTLNQYLFKLGSRPFPFIPTYWLRELIINVNPVDWRLLCLYSGLLLSTAAAGWVLVLGLASRWWYNTWQVLATGDRTRQKPYIPSKSVTPVRWYWRVLPPQLRGLFLKDVQQFWRLPNQWVQFLIMLFFLLIYLANLFNIAIRFNLREPFWQTLIFFINFGFSGFILASMIARYIYPLISLEGPGFWFLRSAPLKISTLFWQKFLLSVGVFLVIAEVIVLVSNYVMRVSSALMVLSAGALILMSVALSAIAVGFGARFPEFNETNPMKIASTAGGFITVIVSLLYVAVVTLVMGLPTYQYFQYLQGSSPFPARSILAGIMLLFMINAGAIVWPLRLGSSHLENIEL